jgi:hypothetical protein
VLLRAALLAAALAGCARGDDDSANASGLVQSSFKEVVVAELKKAGLEAEPGHATTRRG